MSKLKRLTGVWSGGGLCIWQPHALKACTVLHFSPYAMAKSHCWHEMFAQNNNPRGREAWLPLSLRTKTHEEKQHKEQKGWQKETHLKVVVGVLLCISACPFAAVSLSFCLLLFVPSPHFSGLRSCCCPNNPSSRKKGGKKRRGSRGGGGWKIRWRRRRNGLGGGVCRRERK